jgi:hypothetical protein
MISKTTDINFACTEGQKLKIIQEALKLEMSLSDFIKGCIEERFAKIHMEKYKSLLDSAIDIICRKTGDKIDASKLTELNRIIEFLNSRFNENELKPEIIADFYFNLKDGCTVYDTLNEAVRA